MATRLEVEQQIAFGLQRLSSQNRHHDFEHLCRRLARKRICSNIVPATGPVSAGGDQGRDFETFRTYLHELPNTSAFAALASSGPIVFACSLQQESVPSKIKSDIASILGGAPVEEIHFFSTGTVATATRHELQQWARTEHSVHLDIYDREAIAELLGDPDVFWIANEFLSIPSEIYPRELAEDEYAKLKEVWTTPEARPFNYAGFAQLKRIARDMLYDESLRPDVAFWIERFRDFRAHSLDDLAHMAIYEIAVLSLRIKGDMHGQEADIRQFVEYALESIDADRLTDLACLISYCTGALFQSAVSLAAEEVLKIRDRLIRHVQDLLDAAVDPNRKCALLDLRGFVAEIPNPATREFPDVDVTIEYWLQMIALVPQAPLFDLTSFSDRLTATIESLIEGERYDELIQKVDDLLADRTGRYAAARARVSRAEKLIATGRLLLGVRELNRAKHDWFSKETVGISAAALLDLSSHYSRLGLVYAAKYYALAAAWIVLHAGDDRAKRLIRPALIRAGECDYEAGAWLEALDFFSVAQRADAAFSDQPMTDEDSDLYRLVMYGAYILGVSRGQPDLVRDAVEHKIAEWPDREAIEQGSATARESFYKIAATSGGDTQKHLAMPPFIDAAPIRRFEWSALGVNWEVAWPNSLDFTLMAEQFMAVLQLLTADLAPSDLYILPGRVEVRFCPHKGTKECRLCRIPSNQASVWEMSVPTEFNMDDRAKRHRLDISQSIMLLHELSLRPEKWPIVKQLAAVGPYANTMVGELYTTICQRLCDIDVPVLDSEYQDPNLGTIYLRREPHPELAWNRELVDEYDEDEVQVSLRNRYELFGAITRLTLPRLLANLPVRAVLGGLRQDGWLDWQILGAVSGVAMNYRAGREFDPRRDSPKKFQLLVDRYMRGREDESWPEVPLKEFTRERLRFQMITNLMVTIKSAGLARRQQTPNEQAVLDFVRWKMRYFEDDIAHDDILSAPP